MSSSTSQLESDDGPFVLDYFWDFLHAPGRVKVLDGGAGSGKSNSIAQYFVELVTQHEDLVLLAMRKTLPALKRSNWKLLKDTFKAWGVPIVENKNDMTLTFEATGSVIYGVGLDDPEKVKSFDINVVWLEEATEFTKQDYQQANLRCRRKGPIENQVILSFNPIDAYHWCITDLVQGNDPAIAVQKSNYKDNPFLQEEYVNQLLALEQTDRNFYLVYTLGEPGVLENIIYPRFEVIPYDQWPQAVREKGPDAYGLDFGFVNPCALIDVRIHDEMPSPRAMTLTGKHPGESEPLKVETLYWHEVLYEAGLTTPALIRKMDELKVSREVEIFADSAEPDRIEELCQGLEDEEIDGFNAKPTKKIPVDKGIDTVKGYRLVISAESVNMLKEIRAYKRKETKDGRVLEEPVKFMDHAMDGGRYGTLGAREAGPMIWEL